MYEQTWASLYVELCVSKMKIQANDLYDLSNLVYVSPGDKYWTKEKRWQRIIQDTVLGQGKYLVEYMDHNFHIKK